MVASLTVTIKGVISTAGIDAHEGRDIAKIDIPHDFLWAENDSKAIIQLQGKTVDLLVTLDPSLCRKYVIIGKKGELVLYIILSKDLYGLLKSALLFYRKIRG